MITYRATPTTDPTSWHGLQFETVSAATLDYDEMMAEYDREAASGISDDEYYDSRDGVRGGRRRICGRDWVMSMI